MTFDEDVRRGMTLLDTEEPNWRYIIDLNSLDMSDCEECILGQIYGTYCEGRETLGIAGTDDSIYGFDISPEISKVLHKNAYRRLQKAWQRALEAS